MKVVFTLQPTINTGDFSNTKIGIVLEQEIIITNPAEITLDEIERAYSATYQRLAEQGRALLRDQIITITKPDYIRRRALAQIGFAEEQPKPLLPDDEDTIREMEASDDHFYDDDGPDYSEDGDEF